MTNKKTKLKLIPLPDRVALWRKTYPGGVVTVFTENNDPLTLERINFLLDRAKNDVLGPNPD